MGTTSGADLYRGDAERLARTQAEECRRQLAFLPHVAHFASSQGAYLRCALEEGYGPLKGFALQQAQQARALAARRKRSEDVTKKASQSREKRFSEALASFLGGWANQWEKTHPEAFTAFQCLEKTQRQALRQNPIAQGALGREALAVFEQPPVRADRIVEFCHQQGHKFGVQPLTFWEWDATRNLQPFAPDPNQSSKPEEQ